MYRKSQLSSNVWWTASLSTPRLYLKVKVMIWVKCPSIPLLGALSPPQSTMVVLQALSEYLINKPPPGDLSLDVDVRLTGRKEIRYHFNPRTAYAARSSRVREPQRDKGKSGLTHSFFHRHFEGRRLCLCSPKGEQSTTEWRLICQCNVPVNFHEAKKHWKV